MDLDGACAIGILQLVAFTKITGTKRRGKIKKKYLINKQGEKERKK